MYCPMCYDTDTGDMLYTCRSIERAAQHEAKRTEQKAKGELERQKLQNEKV